MTKEEQDFVAAVQAALTSDLVPKEYRDRPENPMFGQSCGAAEALYRLLGGKERGYKAQRATDNDGISHWWILSPAGGILDPTSAQYIDFGKVPPYDRGRGAAFHSRSRRAEIIVERVSSSAKARLHLTPGDRGRLIQRNLLHGPRARAPGTIPEECVFRGSR